MVHIAADDGHVARVRLLYLIHEAAIKLARLRVLLPDVNIIEQYSDTYCVERERVLLNVEFACEPGINDVVEVAVRGDLLETVILPRNNVLHK